MAASGSAWRAGWRRPVRRSRSSGATRRNRMRRSPNSSSAAPRRSRSLPTSPTRPRSPRMVERTTTRIRPHRYPGQQRRHQHPQAAACARPRGMGQRHQDQPHQRVPVLAGGAPRDEGRGRRQDHQYRLDDVDLRRQLRAGLCREQRRHRAVHPLLRGGLGRRQHPGQRHPAGLDRHRSDQTRPRGDRRPARQGVWRARRRRAGARSTILRGSRCFCLQARRISSPAPRSPSMADFR